jgi:hypothetical protein
MDYEDMEGVQAYMDENGNIVYMHPDMMEHGDEDDMGDEEDMDGMHGDSYGHEGSPGDGMHEDHYGDVS